MNHLSRTLAIVAAISLAAPVWAQTEAAPAEEQAPVASGVSVSERPAQGEAEPDGYLSSEHGSWQVRCMHATDGSDPCQMYQLVKDADGNRIEDAKITISLTVPTARGGKVVRFNAYTNIAGRYRSYDVGSVVMTLEEIQMDVDPASVELTVSKPGYDLVRTFNRSKRNQKKGVFEVDFTMAGIDTGSESDR